ncbi:MAG TPA: hypothetical protein PK694_01435 [Rhodospirillales bacterium]|nr:hypothetical protein [Rhodospirillales bacterium]
MATYKRQMQKIVDDYRVSGQPWPASTSAIAAWAISNGRWQLPTAAAHRRCAEDIAAAVREEYITDRKGRRVRLLHPATVKASSGQLVLWDDFRTAPRSHMEISFQQRRQGIVGDCRQFKTDVDSYNDGRPAEEPIEIVFDFTMDLAELEAAEDAA